MSILIKGMEMPKGNDELRLIIHSNGQVIISHQTYYEETEAVPVPPHGDLIDRRKLPLAFIDVTDLPTDRCLPVYLQEDVGSASVVVESEET